MSRRRWWTPVLSVVVVVWGLCPHAAWACAACFGQSDSPMAKGMNWGIFSLLAVVVLVLGTLASFFVYLGRKAAAVSAASASGPLLSTDKI